MRHFLVWERESIDPCDCHVVEAPTAAEAREKVAKAEPQLTIDDFTSREVTILK